MWHCGGLSAAISSERRVMGLRLGIALDFLNEQAGSSANCTYGFRCRRSSTVLSARACGRSIAFVIRQCQVFCDKTYRAFIDRSSLRSGLMCYHGQNIGCWRLQVARVWKGSSLRGGRQGATAPPAPPARHYVPWIPDLMPTPNKCPARMPLGYRWSK
jgi:hypothetical protein